MQGETITFKTSTYNFVCEIIYILSSFIYFFTLMMNLVLW